MDTAEGLVIQKNIWGEEGYVLTVFTLNYGKIKVVDQFLRRKERIGAQADLYSRVIFQFNRSEKYDTHYLVNVDNLDKYVSLYTSVFMPIAMGVLAEIIELGFPCDEPQKELYQVMVEFLDHPAVSEGTDEASLGVYMAVLLAMLLRILGHTPDLIFCGHCRKSLGEDVYIVSHVPMIVCRNCVAPVDHCLHWDQETWHLFKSVVNFQHMRADILSQKNKIYRVIDVLCLYIQSLLQRELRSYHVWREVVQAISAAD